MVNYSEVNISMQKKLRSRLQDGQLDSILKNRIPGDTTGFNLMFDKELLSEQTLYLYFAVDRAREKAEAALHQGRSQGLSPGELQRLKDSFNVKTTEALEDAKTKRIQAKSEFLQKEIEKSRAGGGMNPTERLLRLELAKLEINAFEDKDISELLKDYENDIDVPIDRNMLLLIAESKPEHSEKAKKLLKALPPGSSMTGEMKRALIEIEQLSTAKLGAFPYVSNDGKLLGEIHACDFINTKEVKLKAEDFIKE